jgi:LytTR family transcriptional regulator, CO-responsive transcriptional regulator RcoM
VLRLHSDGHYTRVISRGGPDETAVRNQFCNLSIGDLEARLDPAHFVRVHRSHIVNLRAVQQLLRGDGRLALRMEGEETPVPVSRTSTQAVLKRLGAG